MPKAGTDKCGAGVRCSPRKTMDVPLMRSSRPPKLIKRSTVPHSAVNGKNSTKEIALSDRQPIVLLPRFNGGDGEDKKTLDPNRGVAAASDKNSCRSAVTSKRKTVCHSDNERANKSGGYFKKTKLNSKKSGKDDNVSSFREEFSAVDSGKNEIIDLDAPESHYADEKEKNFVSGTVDIVDEDYLSRRNSEDKGEKVSTLGGNGLKANKKEIQTPVVRGKTVDYTICAPSTSGINKKCPSKKRVENELTSNLKNDDTVSVKNHPGEEERHRNLVVSLRKEINQLKSGAKSMEQKLRSLEKQVARSNVLCKQYTKHAETCPNFKSEIHKCTVSSQTENMKERETRSSIVNEPSSSPADKRNESARVRNVTVDDDLIVVIDDDLPSKNVDSPSTPATNRRTMSRSTVPHSGSTSSTATIRNDTTVLADIDLTGSKKMISDKTHRDSTSSQPSSSVTLSNVTSSKRYSDTAIAKTTQQKSPWGTPTMVVSTSEIPGHRVTLSNPSSTTQQRLNDFTPVNNNARSISIQRRSLPFTNTNHQPIVNNNAFGYSVNNDNRIVANTDNIAIGNVISTREQRNTSGSMPNWIPNGQFLLANYRRLFSRQ